MREGWGSLSLRFRNWNRIFLAPQRVEFEIGKEKREAVKILGSDGGGLGRICV